MKLSYRLGLFLGLSSLLIGCATVTTYTVTTFNYYDKSGEAAKRPNGWFSVVKTAQQCEITMTGHVTADAPRAFGEAVSFLKSLGCDEVGYRVSLRSPGGGVLYAMQVGEMIRSEGMQTLIPSSDTNCEFACSLVFISGASRHVADPWWGKAKLAFHQTYTFNDEGRRVCQQGGASVMRGIKQYATEMLGSESAADRFMAMTVSAQCDMTKWVTAEDLLNSNIATDLDR